MTICLTSQKKSEIVSFATVYDEGYYYKHDKKWNCSNIGKNYILGNGETKKA